MLQWNHIGTPKVVHTWDTPRVAPHNTAKATLGAIESKRKCKWDGRTERAHHFCLKQHRRLRVSGHILFSPSRFEQIICLRHARQHVGPYRGESRVLVAVGDINLKKKKGDIAERKIRKAHCDARRATQTGGRASSHSTSTTGVWAWDTPGKGLPIMQEANVIPVAASFS